MRVDRCRLLGVLFVLLICLMVQLITHAVTTVDLGSTLVANVATGSAVALPTHRADVGQAVSLREPGPIPFFTASVEDRRVTDGCVQRDRKPTVPRARSHPVRLRSPSADDAPSA